MKGCSAYSSSCSTANTTPRLSKSTICRDTPPNSKVLKRGSPSHESPHHHCSRHTFHHLHGSLNSRGFLDREYPLRSARNIRLFCPSSDVRAGDVVRCSRRTNLQDRG